VKTCRQQTRLARVRGINRSNRNRNTCILLVVASSLLLCILLTSTTGYQRDWLFAGKGHCQQSDSGILRMTPPKYIRNQNNLVKGKIAI